MQRFKNILAVIELKQSPDRVLARAVSLAKNNQAKLSVVCVVPEITAGIGMPEGGPISAQLQAAAIADARQQLEQAIGSIGSQTAVQTAVLVGTPFLEIIREVLRNAHDLLIKAPEDPDWIERLFGSDDMHLLRKCPCPVWLVKDASAASYRRILAAVDVDADHPASELPVRHQLNIQILEMAASLALSDFAELHVVHAWQAIGENAMRGPYLAQPDVDVDEYVEQTRDIHESGLNGLLDELTSRWDVEAGKYLSPQKHVIKGLPRREIPALARTLEADLLVMGTVGRTGVPGLFIGNTAETILEQIECSVLAVKPEGFRTPVSVDA